MIRQASPLFGTTGRPNLNAHSYITAWDKGLEMRPTSGGDTGNVTVKITGFDFRDGAVVSLVNSGQPDIVGTRANVGENGSLITTTFDLRGAARGPWNVVVSQPGRPDQQLPQAFTVEEGRPPQLWVGILGRDVIRPVTEQRYALVWGNTGNTDAEDVVLLISSEQAEVNVLFGDANDQNAEPRRRKPG